MLFFAFTSDFAGFAERFRALGDVQHVVDDLKSQTDAGGEFGQQHVSLRVHLGVTEQGTNLHGHADERAGLGRMQGLKLRQAELLIPPTRGRTPDRPPCPASLRLPPAAEWP